MIDVKEALSLEHLDNYIDKKNEKLNQEIFEYNDLIKKYRLFISQYKEGMASLTDTLGHKVEGLHNMIDTFISSYELLNNKINGLEEELLGHDKEYEGEVSLNIEHELLNKLKNELDVAKKNVGSILDSYIKEYDEAQRQLDKAISKLQKLKAKVIKKGE